MTQQFVYGLDFGLHYADGLTTDAPISRARVREALREQEGILVLTDEDRFASCGIDKAAEIGCVKLRAMAEAGRNGAFFDLGAVSITDEARHVAEQLSLRGMIRAPYSVAGFVMTLPGRETPDILIVEADEQGRVVETTAFSTTTMRGGAIAALLNDQVALRHNANSTFLAGGIAGAASAHETVALTLVALMMVSDDRVPVARHTPESKVNAARAKKGKTPITPYWRVDASNAADLYVTDLSRQPRGATGRPVGGSRGTHASPVPHSRRGHPRKLPSGATTWVRPTMVGDAAKHMKRTRAFYSVQEAGRG